MDCLNIFFHDSPKKLQGKTIHFKEKNQLCLKTMTQSPQVLWRNLYFVLILEIAWKSRQEQIWLPNERNRCCLWTHVSPPILGRFGQARLLGLSTGRALFIFLKILYHRPSMTCAFVLQLYYSFRFRYLSESTSTIFFEHLVTMSTYFLLHKIILMIDCNGMTGSLSPGKIVFLYYRSHFEIHFCNTSFWL